MITDILTNKVTITQGSISGNGVLPDALLAQLKQVGQGKNWQIDVQASDGRVAVQFNFVAQALLGVAESAPR